VTNDNEAAAAVSNQQLPESRHIDIAHLPGIGSSLPCVAIKCSSGCSHSSINEAWLAEQVGN
jgi:hypothetical protein